MSNINDETVRAKMRKLRVSTFADVFYEIVNDEAYADALPEDIFLAAVEEAYTQRQQRNIARPSPRHSSDTPMRAWPKSPRLNNVASTCAS